MRERDVVSSLRKFAEGIYVGAVVDIRLWATTIDVRRLPESPWHAFDIHQTVVDMFMRAIEGALQEGEVLITCTYGVNRAPSIAKLYCIGEGLPFDWNGSFPNKALLAFEKRQLFLLPTKEVDMTEKQTGKKVYEEKALSPDQAVRTEKKLPTKDEKKAPVASEKNERVALSPDQAVQTVKKAVVKKADKVVCLYCGATYPEDRETCPDCGTLKS